MGFLAGLRKRDFCCEDHRLAFYASKAAVLIRDQDERSTRQGGRTGLKHGIAVPLKLPTDARRSAPGVFVAHSLPSAPRIRTAGRAPRLTPGESLPGLPALSDCADLRTLGAIRRNRWTLPTDCYAGCGPVFRLRPSPALRPPPLSVCAPNSGLRQQDLALIPLAQPVLQRLSAYLSAGRGAAPAPDTAGFANGNSALSPATRSARERIGPESLEPATFPLLPTASAPLAGNLIAHLSSRRGFAAAPDAAGFTNVVSAPLPAIGSARDGIGPESLEPATFPLLPAVSAPLAANLIAHLSSRRGFAAAPDAAGFTDELFAPLPATRPARAGIAPELLEPASVPLLPAASAPLAGVPLTAGLEAARIQPDLAPKGSAHQDAQAFRRAGAMPFRNRPATVRPALAAHAKVTMITAGARAKALGPAGQRERSAAPQLANHLKRITATAPVETLLKPKDYRSLAALVPAPLAFRAQASVRVDNQRSAKRRAG